MLFDCKDCINMENLQTPPDTVAVRKALLHHRRALADINVANNLQDGFATPPAKVEDARLEERIPVPITPFRKFEKRVEDLILYRNPTVSFLAVIIGSLVLSSVRYFTSGENGVSLLTGLCYLVLARMGYLLGASLFSSNPTSRKLKGSKSMEAIEEMMKQGVSFIGDVHDSFIAADSPSTCLYVCGCLWLLSQLGKVFSIGSICIGIFLTLFSIPYAYYSQKDALSPHVREVWNGAVSRWKSLGINRRQQNVLALALLSFAWMWTSWSNRIIGLLMALMAIRRNLTPQELTIIREQAAPLTQSVKKSARRFSMAATDFAHRALRT